MKERWQGGRAEGGRIREKGGESNGRRDRKMKHVTKRMLEKKGWERKERKRK